jgi:glycosyltransferase involved in cell wall biosynthesis
MTPTEQIEDLASGMTRMGVRRVHVLAWRDLDDPDAGGSELHAHEFMRRFTSAGLQVLHRTSAAVGVPETSERSGYSVVRRGSRFNVFPRAVASEITHRMGDYDALIEIWNGVPWLSPLWCRKPSIVFLHHVHGPMWEQILPGPFAAAGRFMETRMAPPVYRRSRVLTPSEATREELLALGFHSDRVTAVNNGVDPYFSPGAERDAAPTVVAVGRLAPVKRFDRLIEAAVQAHKEVPEMRLIIAGEGPERPRLDALIRAHQAQSWISMVGHVTREGLLDLDNRKGKAPGGYCTEFAVARRPFIFTNAVGLHEDVLTLLHEGGHAFHVFETASLPYFQQKQVGLEFAEVASMSMELLSAPYLAASEGGF